MTIDRECTKLMMALSTLNFVLIFFGYQFIASVGAPFMNVNTGTQFITIPYRAFSLALALYLIFRSKESIPFHSFVIKCLWCFWLILFIRLIIDFYLQSSFVILEQGKQKVLLWMLVISFPQILAYAKTWNKINYNQAFLLCMLFLSIIVITNLLFNKALLSDTFITNSGGRIDGGLAMNTITFGHCGGSLALLSIFSLHNNKKKWIGILLLLLGLFVMLRAGSRGPLFSFIIVTTLFYALKSKQIIYAVLIALIIGLIVYIFQDVILDAIKEISPVLYRRLNNTIEYGDMTGRDVSFQKALDIWYNNPIMGKFLTLYLGNPAYPVYSHNIILDAAISGGMIGVGLMLLFYYTVIKSLFYSLTYNPTLSWIPVIVLQSYVGCLSSGNFYGNPILSVGILCIALLGLNTTNDVKDHFMTQDVRNEENSVDNSSFQ